jgi:hypothetical protein
MRERPLLVDGSLTPLINFYLFLFITLKMPSVVNNPNRKGGGVAGLTIRGSIHQEFLLVDFYWFWLRNLYFFDGRRRNLF